MRQSPPDPPSFPSDAAGPTGPGHRQPGPLPRWRLVLLNCGMTDLMVIVRTIMELTHFCRTEATHKMWQAHHWGRALLLTTHRERAELYVEQFADKGVVVAVEPV
jgi:ATP-dependent Clp protease adapter protein ClpS